MRNSSYAVNGPMEAKANSDMSEEASGLEEGIAKLWMTRETLSDQSAACLHEPGTA